MGIERAASGQTTPHPRAARLIQLRYFGGLSLEDAASVVGVPRSTAYVHWSYAKVRLRTLLDGE